jgi:hypothetical protein
MQSSTPDLRRRPHRPRILAAALVLAVLASVGLVTAPAASAADVIIPIEWNIDASTHIKSLNMDVTVPTGTFVGQVNLTTGQLTGNLTLPPATQNISILGIPLASATFAMTSNGPITGTVDLLAGTVTVNASFSFNITRASASIFPWLNLVGNRCRGSQPITQTLSGPINLAGASTFSSTYTIPKFKDCGLLTPILNLIIPGSGNTFTATFAPPVA